MCTPSRQLPPSSRWSEIASSKSRAFDRIDRDDRQAGQVEPAGRNRLVELLRLPPGLFENVFLETFRQVELAEDRQRVDPRLAPRAEHLDDHAFAVLCGRGEADHFEDHLVVRPRALCARIADANRLREECPIDLDESRPAGFEVEADEPPRLPIDHFDDSSPRAEGRMVLGRGRRSAAKSGPCRRVAVARARGRRWRRRRCIFSGCRCPRRRRCGGPRRCPASSPRAFLSRVNSCVSGG